METFEQYGLINQKQWSTLLESLRVGTHTFVFPTFKDIRSCKTVAYLRNTERIGRKYSFKVIMPDKRVEITVKEA